MVFGKKIFVIFFLGLSSAAWASDALTLNSQNVKDLALQQSLIIQQSILEKNKMAFGLTQAKSIYDTTLKAHYQYYRDNSERTTSIFGTQTRSTNFGGDIMQQTPWGMGLTLGYQNIKESTNSPFVTTSPIYNAQMAISASQPLLKNALGYQNRKSITSAKKQIESFDLATQAKIESTVFQILTHYWNFYWATHNLAYEKEALTSSKKLLDANLKNKDLGMIENSDLAAFKANSQSREAAYLEAKNIYTAALETLRYDLALENEITIKTAEGKNTSSPGNKNEALEKAMMNRSDYLALKKDLDAKKITLSMKKNALWPQLDVNASLALNGVDDTNSKANNKFDDVNEAWGMGMNLNVPFQNRFSRAELGMAKMDKAKKVLEIKDKENEIVKEITESLTRYQNRILRLKAAKLATQNYQVAFTGENEKFTQGRSNSNTLIDSQNNLINFKKQELNAKMDLMLSLTELEYVKGMLLKEKIN